ncbi:MAG: hypothetical protein Q9N26_06485, partial [Aquificota bacterium]|nr:hypothetical protein [Aquificota bacterium]
ELEKFLRIRHFMLSLEGKLTGTYAEVTVADDYAVVLNLALRFTLPPMSLDVLAEFYHPLLFMNPPDPGRAFNDYIDLTKRISG